MNITPIFFDGWAPIVRAAVLTVCAYAALLAFLRVTGKRTLSQLNVFDWVVTVALGSTLAGLIVSQDVALAQGLTALGGLVALQFLVALGSSRSERFRSLVTGEPALLVRDGELLRRTLRRERVAESEVLQALRQAGVFSPDEAEAVVLETNGSMTVLRRRERDAPVLPRS